MPWWSHMTMLRKRNRLLHDDVYQMVAPLNLGVSGAAEPHPSNRRLGQDSAQTQVRRATHLVGHSRQILQVADPDVGSFPSSRSTTPATSKALQLRGTTSCATSTSSGVGWPHAELKRKGFSDDAAYDEMVIKYQESIQKRRDSMRIANGVRASNGFRNLWDYYQQQAVR